MPVSAALKETPTLVRTVDTGPSRPSKCILPSLRASFGGSNGKNGSTPDIARGLRHNGSYCNSRNRLNHRLNGSARRFRCASPANPVTSPGEIPPKRRSATPSPPPPRSRRASQTRPRRPPLSLDPDDGLARRARHHGGRPVRGIARLAQRAPARVRCRRGLPFTRGRRVRFGGLGSATSTRPPRTAHPQAKSGRRPRLCPRRRAPARSCL
jgi:hypothetical protein